MGGRSRCDRTAGRPSSLCLIYCCLPTFSSSVASTDRTSMSLLDFSKLSNSLNDIVTASMGASVRHRENMLSWIYGNGNDIACVRLFIEIRNEVGGRILV